MADPENTEKMMLGNDVGKGHGRIEIRETTVCHDVDMLRNPHYRPGLQAVGQVTSTRENKGERNTETRFFLLSEQLGPEQCLKTVRMHRAVETSLHRSWT